MTLTPPKKTQYTSAKTIDILKEQIIKMCIFKQRTYACSQASSKWCQNVCNAVARPLASGAAELIVHQLGPRLLAPFNQ